MDVRSRQPGCYKREMRLIGADTLVTWACAGLAVAFPAYWLASGMGSYFLILLGWLAAGAGAAWGFGTANDLADPLERATARAGAFVAVVAALASLALVVFVVVNLG